ncbi:type III glutamate--ammonia ligase [Acidisoma cellulosilytica]|uniref:Type III glutamate--ammonia ligase n=1 Tax=Acidisoma cellulosilyticum TaxID=2802395 RepID=A0A963Z5U4_9PROT|nr:type III glutamate--ammonia ligase [Acidisoma cellulosilyticum]MCB8883372.1 type III glutamate--ammonia ligase [Acidisoma cellulosilyticum]
MDAGASQLHEKLKSDLAAAKVDFLMASYVDMHGVPKAKIVPLAHLEDMLAGSEMFTGAALDGVPQNVNDDEVATYPDAATCTVLPWRRNVAWFASDLWLKDAPFEACSRSILKRQMDDAASLGFTFNLGIEAEFYVMREDESGKKTPITTRKLHKPAYDAASALDNLDWLGEMVNAMNEIGWDVYSFDQEDGTGQFELDFAFDNAVTTSDRFVFLRMMAQQIAARHGSFATFMPKPFAEMTGSGAHFNMSFADRKTGQNLFKSDNDPRNCGLSTLGYQFIAGVIRHLPAICAVVAPTVNSYKRLVKQGSMSGFTWAPIFACYGNNNRTNALRIPMAGGRVELRAADSSCNPYLAAAMILAAGLEGVREGLDPGEPNRMNMYEASPAELDRLGIGELPRSLGEAVEAFEADPLSSRVMGSLMAKSWADYKKDEWLSYTAHVSDWEVSRYLKFY